MNLTLDKEETRNQLSQLVQQELAKLISPEQRDRMIREALQVILIEKDKYRGKTPVQEAFEFTLRDLMRELMEAQIRTPEVLERVRTIVAGAIQKTLYDEASVATLSEKISDLFGKFLSDQRY